MKFFSIGCIMMYTAIMGTLTIVSGLMLRKIFPEIGDVLITFSWGMMFFFLVLFAIAYRLLVLMEMILKNKGIEQDKNSTPFYFLLDEKGMRWGLCIGTVAFILGECVIETSFPIDYFYFGNIGLTIIDATFGLFCIQLGKIANIEIPSLWNKIANENNKIASNFCGNLDSNLFHISQRPAGIRLFITDIIVIIVGILLTSFLWFYSYGDSVIQVFSLLPLFVVAHFFMFCNIFRISRNKEICWAIFFIFNISIRYFWCSVYQSPIHILSFWWIVLLLQTPVSCFFIIWEILSEDYHGICYKLIPWGRNIRSKVCD